MTNPDLTMLRIGIKVKVNSPNDPYWDRAEGIIVDSYKPRDGANVYYVRLSYVPEPVGFYSEELVVLPNGSMV
jgi:hypothetical protein